MIHDFIMYIGPLSSLQEFLAFLALPRIFRATVY
jgi:hypothetical protein